ncbi:MAG: hypothetical protein DRR42_18390 [Gammaproteobacteria bacterium]|nr:MAG: hypothetical protein DRR42_18390 [Gammaproteobacteria bacterium]
MQSGFPVTIGDEDIAWAEKLLHLPRGAFDQERKDAIKELGCFDVQACPGSGKTTLVVAKLAILAKKWPYSTRGICVVSHTNVARKEIQDRLGRTEIGQKLLSYPHFIGTIHGFVNQFVALPWIRSKGWPIAIVDTEITLNRRWSKLRHETRYSNQLRQLKERALESKTIGTPPPIKSGRGFLGETSPMGTELRTVISDSYVEGYFTYDEMFLFAKEFLGLRPELPETITHRFPVLFVDEAQDCSESQNSIVSQLFPTSSALLIRQRFGDGNQAIFNSTYSTTAIVTEPFPDISQTKTVSNSHRLHPSICKLADPLGLIPYNMTGIGAATNKVPSKHSIFIFEDNSIAKVLPAYAELVLDQFSESQLDGTGCFAVGQVHNMSRDEPVGAHVQHYWSAYSPSINKAEPSATHLVDYFWSAIEQVGESKELYKGLELVFKGIIRMLRQVGVEKLSSVHSPYRKLRGLSIDHMDKFTSLCGQIQSSLVDTLTEEMWSEELIDAITSWSQQCFGVTIDAGHPFLLWSAAPTSPGDPAECHNTNVFSFISNDRKVDIHLGSIHSVKGQTHRATLVLDTFWSGRNGKTNLAYISDWLCGKKSGAGTEGPQNLTRLKCHYVAMTRPTDLLCLAIHKFHIHGLRDELTACGWDLIDLQCSPIS